MLREEWHTSRGLDPCSTDLVERFGHAFIILSPHGVLNMCLPDEGCEFW